MSFISFEDVKKTYKMGEVEINALDGVSFDIEQENSLLSPAPQEPENPPY